MNLPFIFLLLLFGHVIGDFYLQPTKMAEGKNKCKKHMVVHGCIYAVCAAVVLFPGVEFELNLLWLWAFIVAAHFGVDVIKCLFKRKEGYRKIYKKIPIKLGRDLYKGLCKKAFLLDQIAHLILLGIAWCWFGRGLLPRGWVIELLPHFSQRHFVMLLGMLIILRPVGLLIKKGGIWDFSKTGKTKAKTQAGAGRMIGNLERMIVFFLLIHGQYAAISFVIAAKSIMRFPEISGETDDKSALAEYYLIGTLLSMTSVFVTALLLGLMAT